MTLWWIGNTALIAVVIPVVVVILRRVMAPVRAIEARAGDLVEVGGAIEIKLNAVPDLAQAQRQVRSTRQGLERYGAALDEIL